MKGIGWCVAEIWPFEVSQKCVNGPWGRWSLVGRQYSYFLHWSHILLFAERTERGVKMISTNYLTSQWKLTEYWVLWCNRGCGMNIPGPYCHQAGQWSPQELQTYTHRHSQRDRQSDRQTDWQRDKQTDGRTDRYQIPSRSMVTPRTTANIHTDTHRQTDRQTDRDRQTDSEHW